MPSHVVGGPNGPVIVADAPVEPVPPVGPPILPSGRTPRQTGEWHRAADNKWYWKATHFWLAPLVEDWKGLSLTRFLAIAIFAGTVDIAHDILAIAKDAKVSLGWWYVAIVVGGFFTAAVVAIGQKAILLVATIVGNWIGKKVSGQKPAPGA